jgi:hypothetical protein
MYVLLGLPFPDDFKPSQSHSLTLLANISTPTDFTPWKGVRVVEKHTHLPQCIQKLTGQDKCPIGDAGT